MRHGRAAAKDFALGVSGALFLMPPRGGLCFAIQFRCYPMRIVIPLFLLMLVSCAGPERPFEAPRATEGGWKLTTLGALPAAPPEWMTRIGLKQSFEARYAGPIDTVADIYVFNAESSAFECMQRWRAVKTEDQFYKKNVFVVIRSPHPNREMLMDFSRALQKVL